jgi:RNA polymerase sigma-70 factor (ECF subfamily)
LARNYVAGVAGVDDDVRLVELLRAGDERAFAALIDRYHTVMLRLATVYVRDRAVAQDVVQDTWLGVLRGLDRFEARSPLKTWIFHILVNTAKTRAVREKRTIPLSALWDPTTTDSFEPAVEPERFLPADAPRWPGHWTSLPPGWDAMPEERLLSGETRSLIHAAIDALPPSQREVVSLRDSEGWTAEEVCNILQISETNQRVLLHRGRSRVRRALERYLTGT